MEELYYIELTYATYGIIVKNAIIVETPPIAKWMIGKNIIKITSWITNKKQGKITKL